MKFDFAKHERLKEEAVAYVDEDGDLVFFDEGDAFCLMETGSVVPLDYDERVDGMNIATRFFFPGDSVTITF